MKLCHLINWICDRVIRWLWGPEDEEKRGQNKWLCQNLVVWSFLTIIVESENIIFNYTTIKCSITLFRFQRSEGKVKKNIWKKNYIHNSIVRAHRSVSVLGADFPTFKALSCISTNILSYIHVIIHFHTRKLKCSQIDLFLKQPFTIIHIVKKDQSFESLTTFS